MIVRLLTFLAVVAWMAGLWLEPERALRAYLWSYLVILGLPLGALTWIMIHRLTDGRWGRPLLPLAVSAAGTILPVACLFLPIALGLEHLYPWVGNNTEQILIHRKPWLNTTAVLIRAGLYFALWIAMAWYFRRRRSGPPELPGVLLTVHLVVCSLMALDWIVSLETHFYSTIFGLLVMVGQALLAMSVFVLLLAHRGTEPDVLYDLGGLLLVSVMLLAYLSFSQLVVVWSGDQPHRIEWYLPRLWEAWQPVAWSLFLAYLVVPFLCLPWGSFKRDPVKLGRLALLTTVMSPVHVMWLVLPALYPHAPALHWLDAAALAALGGLWCLFFNGGGEE